MKVSVKMLQDLGVCGPASTYVGQWFIDNNIQIIDYDLGMKHLKSLMGHGQAWINENVSDTEHADYVNWIEWYAKLPTTLEAITYFNDHIVENTFQVTADYTLHDSLDGAVSHARRLVNELKDDYLTKIVVNGVALNEDGAETWLKINDVNNDDLSQFSYFICHDIFTGVNHKVEDKDSMLLHYTELLNYVETMTTNFKNSIEIKQKYMCEAEKYTIWVKVDVNI